MKRGLIVAPAWLTAMAVFNSAHCAGSSATQTRHI